MVSKFDRIYYEEELRYLAEEGREFAKRHPDIAQYLALEELNPQLRDPHSERIIEAFAFLTGRLRRFMDQQFPELVHSLFNLVFPHYLRPLPSKTLVSLTPMTSMLDKPTLVPKGTLIYSEEVGDPGRSYTFSTTQPVEVQPIDVLKVHVDPDVKADFSLSVHCGIHAGADATKLKLDQLEFCLFGDPSQVYELFHQLSQNLIEIRLKGRGSHALSLKWTGFDADHQFHRDESPHFAQLHLLRDYFDFPKKYFFFQIDGLQKALDPFLKDLTDFQLDFIFKQPFSSGSKWNKDHFRLFCSPAQNVFPVLTEPISVDGKQLEYLIVPELTRPDEEIFSVERVIASKDQIKNDVHAYYHFSFDTISQKGRWFFTLRRDHHFEAGWDTFMRFLDLDEEGPEALVGQIVSIQALCTNRGEAQNVKMGQLKKLDSAIPETIQCRNITQVSKASWPAIHSRGDWDFISHLALNFSDLSDVNHLKRLLTLYNMSQSDSGKRKISGILAAHMEKDVRIIFGQAVHGRKLTLHVDELFFQHEGDVSLFCMVFGSFLRAYCPINSFIRLVIENKDHSKTWEHIASY